MTEERIWQQQNINLKSLKWLFYSVCEHKKCPSNIRYIGINIQFNQNIKEMWNEVLQVI